MRRIVQTKEELKKAVADGVDEIVVAPELAKDIKPIITAMCLPTKKLAALIAFLAASAAGIITSLALTPATAGLSSVVSSIAAVPTVVVFSTANGTSVVLVVLLILLCVMIGVDCVVKLLRTYDVDEDEVCFEVGGNKTKKEKAPWFVFRRKTKYRGHEK